MLSTLLVSALAITPPLTPVSPRLITVHGHAVMTFPADQATASIQFTGRDREAAGARKAVDVKTAALQRLLTEHGVATQHINLHDGIASAEYRGNEIIAHTWSRTVFVTLVELPRAEKILTAMLKAAGAQSCTLVLRSTALAEWEEKTRIAAAATAKARAQTLVETLGGKLGLPRVVTDQTPSGQGVASATVMLPPVGDAVFVRPELSVTSTVSVQFDIRDEG